MTEPKEEIPQPNLFVVHTLNGEGTRSPVAFYVKAELESAMEDLTDAERAELGMREVSPIVEYVPKAPVPANAETTAYLGGVRHTETTVGAILRQAPLSDEARAFLFTAFCAAALPVLARGIVVEERDVAATFLERMTGESFVAQLLTGQKTIDEIVPLGQEADDEAPAKGTPS